MNGPTVSLDFASRVVVVTLGGGVDAWVGLCWSRACWGGPVSPGGAGFPRASGSFVSVGWVVLGLTEGGADVVPGGRDRGGPPPGGIDAQPQLAGAAGDAGRHMQDPVGLIDVGVMVI